MNTQIGHSMTFAVLKTKLNMPSLREEIVEHERISQGLGIDFFFTHPYAAWERVSNENMNGLVRQYIPKNRNLETVTDQGLKLIMDKLNHHPRKCLDFNSPFEVIFEHSVALAS
jgi:IS30 family transposase